MIYSIDKLKLEFMWVRTDRVQYFLNSLELSNYTSYYESNKMTNCKHNFKFGDGDGAIYLGVVPNWEKEEKSDKNIILEYNPNKVNPFLIKELSFLEGIPKACIRIMSMDIAIDMTLPYSTVRMLKRDVREYYACIGHSSIETRYLGELGHNHVKLYNKAKEQKIKNLNWTRFEITCKKINSLNCELKEFEENIKLPVLYYVCSQVNTDEFELLNDNIRIVLESIIQDINVLYTMKNYKTRKKYEKLLNEFLNPIVIDIKSMYKAYKVCVGEFAKHEDANNIDIYAAISENQ